MYFNQNQNICTETNDKSFNFSHLWKFKSKPLLTFSTNLLIYLSTDHLPRISKIYQSTSSATPA